MSLNFTGHLHCAEVANVKVLGVRRNFLGRQVVTLAVSENGKPPKIRKLWVGDTLAVSLDLEVTPARKDAA